ncbi:hypothetical protein, partial [Aquabacterium sp. A08]|uniref:hypothetical protein n=1 Tax=Aquabacterium sp. A08 TaxID=2718532 RepID=UPI001AAE4BF3
MSKLQTSEGWVPWHGIGFSIARSMGLTIPCLGELRCRNLPDTPPPLARHAEQPFSDSRFKGGISQSISTNQRFSGCVSR